MIVSRSAFNLALNALEDAHERYLQACRDHLADLLEIGADHDRISQEFLPHLDLVKAEQDELVEQIREMAA